MTVRKLITLPAILLAMAASLSGEAIILYTGTTSELYDATIRWTLFQTLQDVTVSGFGILTSRSSQSGNFDFYLYNSDSSGAVVGSPIAQVEDTLWGAAGVNWAYFPTSVNLTTGNYYILKFTLFTGIFIEKTASPAAPFDTDPPWFSVVDGKSGASPTHNAYLPAFSVDATLTSGVPEPASLVLVGASLLALCGFGRRAQRFRRYR